MIFQHTHELVRNGTKTQTRRLCRPGDHSGPRWGHVPENSYSRVVYRHGRLKWYTDGTYAIQPGRGQQAIGRIRLTRIEQTALQYMTDLNAFDEGIQLCTVCLNGYPQRIGDICPACGSRSPVEQFSRLWDAIHRKPGTRWIDNPIVWVLTFELEES